MNAPFTPLIDFAGTVLRLSLQASLVIVLVLLVQWAGRKHLSPRVRCALWLLVVLRLVLPTSLESSVSVFQQARVATTTIARAAKPAPPAPAPAKSVTQTSAAPSSVQVSPTRPLAAKPAPAPTAPVNAPSTAIKPTATPWPWPLILSGVWLAGVLFLLARVVWIPLRLNARLARQETATPPAVFEILEQAKHSIGVNQVLPIVQSRAVESPALLGFIRPWLLLPHGLVEKFSPDELRLVFLHELAHLKRRDIAVNWLTTLLQILHWFNPLVWHAFARMRADREEACDELALAHARAEENRAYGHAIIKLLEGFARPPALPGLVGILEDKQHMQRRITMIAQFKKMIPWSAPAAGLLLVLGLVTLTDAQTEKNAATARIFSADGPAVKTLLSGSGADAAGILSPDESMVAFVEWGSNGGDIIVRDLRTGKTRNLTQASHGAKYESTDGGCWGADSKALAYTWYAEGQGSSVRVIPATGGSPKVICDLKDGYFTPHDWSSDGSLLVGKLVRKAERISSVATLEVATGRINALNPKIGGTEHLRFSPDGRFIVGLGGKVFVVSVEGGDRIALADSSASEGSPVFAADGRHVLFSSNRRGAWDLWSVRCEEGHPVGAPTLVKYDFGDYPKWRTKSGRIAFTIQSNQTGAFEVRIAEGGSASAAEPRELVKSSLGLHAAPAWSPDGKKLAYVRLGKPPMLCVQSLEDGREETFNTGLWNLQSLIWSPDNQTIALRGGGPVNTWGIYLYSLAARERIGASLTVEGHTFVGPLTVGGRVNDRSKTYPLGFSADGTEMHFLLAEQKQRVAFNLKTAQERDISTAADRVWLAKPQAERGPLFQYCPSPDDTKSAYIETGGGEQRIVVVDSAGQNKRVVVRAKAPADLGAPRWSPDGTKLAYFQWPTEDAPRKQLHVCAADGSWDQIVNTGRLFISGSAVSPTWSPDSSRLAVTMNSDIPSQIGLLENLVLEEKLAAK